MARRKKHRARKPEDEPTELAIRVDHWEAETDASINYDIYIRGHPFGLDERDPVYRFITKLNVTGTALWPEERADDIYELRIYGDDAPSRYLNLTLDDLQERDEHRSRKYRTYRGEQIPVFRDPKGFGLLDKVRGEKRWTAWLNAQPRFVSDLLVLLASGRQIYLTLQERKVDRKRWVRNLSAQTTNPAEE